jgi:hypothetical protein
MRDSLITAIIPLNRDPNLRRIDVNGRRVAALRASDVQSLRLRVGLPWTSDLVAEVQQLENSRNAHQKAMNLLGARMYSKAELRERLVRAGFDAPTPRQSSNAWRPIGGSMIGDSPANWCAA